MVHLIFLTIISWSDPATPADSLRMETINGKVFIIHQVGERETLYAISRRYGTPIMSILEFNSTAGSGLEIGQLLKIPYTPKGKTPSREGMVHQVAAGETLFSIARSNGVSVDDLKTWNNLKDNSLSLGQELTIQKKKPATGQVETTAKVSLGSHVVESKETLYSISKRYGVTIQQLKEWNGLPDNDVKVGSVLIVTAGSTSAIPPKRPETATAEVRQLIPVKEEVKPENNENTIRISESVRGSDEVKEGGLAELIEGSDGNRKYLGLHRKAKAGTILKVRNELNNREVFVRVVGSLPDTGVNDNVVIKISRSAFDRLGAIDQRFRVEVTYYK